MSPRCDLERDRLIDLAALVAALRARTARNARVLERSLDLLKLAHKLNRSG
jgi:hypothetical protein